MIPRFDACPSQLGGDYVSVNFNALDGVELADIPTKHWDGRHDNWHAGPRDTPWPMYTPEPARTSTGG